MATKVKLGDCYGYTTTASQVQRAHHNVRNATVNLATVKMPAQAGETVRWFDDAGCQMSAVVWSPGPESRTVWATTDDREYVLLRQAKDGTWFHG